MRQLLKLSEACAKCVTPVERAVRLGCFLRHSSYIGLCLTIIRLFQAKLRQVIVVIFDTSFAGFRVQSAIPQESAALRSKAVAETILATVSKACSAASWLERYVVSVVSTDLLSLYSWIPRPCQVGPWMKCPSFCSLWPRSVGDVKRQRHITLR